MKIILLTSSFPRINTDFSGSFIWHKAVYLTRRDVQVTVICPYEEGSLRYEVLGDISIIRFPYWFTTSGQRLGKSGGLIASIGKSPIACIQVILFFICQLLCALKTIRREHADIIHSHWIIPQGINGAIIHLITKIPHITSVHGTDIHLIHSNKILCPILGIISRLSNIVTTNSTYTNRLVQDVIPDKKFSTFIIPMGVIPEEYPELGTQFHNVGNEKKNILFVGRLIIWKGVQYLIKAMKQVYETIPSSHLIIVGDGPLRSELIELSSQLYLTSSIDFMGRITPQSLLSCYQKASLVVLPSIMHNNQTEGLGVVLLEAMASGVPVIGSDIGGIPDIIEDGVNGFLVPPEDPVALAGAIIRILENPDMAERFRKAGQKTVKERFSWDIVAEQFISVYQKVLLDP